MRNLSPCVAAALLVSCALAVPGYADLFTDHVDANAVRQDLVHLVDLYNGGENGASGAGVYNAPQTDNPNWNGLFQVNLDQQFNQIPNFWNPNMSVISQSRAIYLNTAAYRADPSTGARFLAAAQTGANYLWNKGHDTTYGGFYWGLDVSGNSPPTSTNQIAGTYPTSKMSYGQVHAVFSLAHTAAITGSGTLLDDAFTGWSDYKTHFADTSAGPGAYLPTQNRNYTSFQDSRNVDYMTHALETSLALYDATPSADPRRAGVQQDMLAIGNFITQHMTQAMPGHTDQAYITWSFDANWQPLTGTTVSTGHQVELSYLLSRAVEHGAPTAWLDTAGKLLNYGLAYGADTTPGTTYYGSMIYGTVNPDGSPVGGADVGWWQQAELTRATMEYATLRGRTDLWTNFDAAWAFIQQNLMDPTYGGWFEDAQWNSTTQSWTHPNGAQKGQVWHVGYHETMLYDEMLRLSALTAAVPEPASLALLALGGLATLRRRRA